MSETKVIKRLPVAAGTHAGRLAGSIMTAWEEDTDSTIMLTSIGAGALNQAVKAVILTNGFLSRKGYSAKVSPGFFTAENSMHGIELTLHIQKF